MIPLVGAIDTARAKQLMEVALSEASRLKVEHVILNLSGVPMVDPMVCSASL
ncbi:STAS domain-containing protein [Peribacillus sp. SCS-26]|uniref:STAS domain-containing protein n=1 Tax=Paraperibacillus marinus TaxID=3115295 RepID=UPI00390582D1